MRERLPRYVLLLAAAFLLLAGEVSAQTISGIVAGRVMDAQGKPQATVAIIAQNPETGRGFQASTDSQGYYRILEVPPGLYEVRALLGGYPTVKHVNVRVDVNRTTQEDFVMLTEEKPPLQSSAPMTDLYSPTLGTAFNDKQIIGLPVITRDVNNLALLAPGVVSVRTFSFASTLVPFSVNGSRGRDNNFTIDSVDNNEPLFGGAASQLTNNEIFQEYSISTGQLKAEFGRNTGATVNVITKSGSNNWHGTLFSYGQGDVFDAMNRVEKQALLTSPEPFYETTVGATLGGPVKKDKSFVFISYQWDHLTDNLSDVFPVLSNYPQSPADLAVITGLATGPGVQAYLATPSVQSVPGLGGITPCFLNNPVNDPLGLYQSPNPCLVNTTAVPVSGDLAGPALTSNFNVWNVPNANTFNLRDHQVSGRFDQKINDANDIYARYLFDDFRSPRAPLESAGVGAFSDIGLLPDWKQFIKQRTQSFLIDHRFRQASGALNEFRLSYSRVSQQQGAFDAPPDTLNMPSAIASDCYAGTGRGDCQPLALGGLGGLPSASPGSGQFGNGGVFPSAGSLVTLGTDSGPSRITSNTYQLQDDYSFTHGRHNIKLGANFAKIDTNVLGIPDDNGFYAYTTFLDRYTGQSENGLESLFNEGQGLCQQVDWSGNITGTPFNPFQGSCANVVSKRFTNVKYDASGAPLGLGQDELRIKGFNQFYFAQDDWRVKNNLTLSLGIRYENFGQPINSVHDLNPAAPLVKTDNKDFAPRLGFAWSPANNWVIRGGYGISYNPPILNIPLLLWESGPVSPLVTTDVVGLSQTSPRTNTFPNAPLTIADLQNPIPAGSNSGAIGEPYPAATTSGMVQGCSLYFDLFHLFGGGNLSTPFPGRAFQSAAQGPVNIPITNCSAQDTVSKNLKNPYVQQWTFGIQRQLGSDYMLEVNYVGSKGTRLFQRVENNPFQGWDGDCLQNISALYGLALANLAVPGQCRLLRIDDSHGDVSEVTNGGSSSYNALQATLTKRYSHVKHFGDVLFSATYTWSHLIDNTSEIFGPGFRTFSGQDVGLQTGGGMGFSSPLAGLGLLFDPLANEPVEAVTPLAQTYNSTTDDERGNSSFDRRHRFSASFLWEPFPNSNAWLRGWELGGIITYQSGQPFSPLNASPLSACADANGDGSVSNDRPDIGNPNAPLRRVALIDTVTDPFCLPAGFPGAPAVLNYVDLNGNPIDPSTAHFVQRPLFSFSPSNAQPLPGLTLTGNPNTLAASLGQQYSGTAGRNTLVGPSITEVDLSIYKTISFTERVKLQLRVEAYDLFNQANPGYFNGDPYIGNSTAAPAFGYATTRTGAAITGGIPENAIDAINQSCSPAPASCAATGLSTNRTFLSRSAMNTSSRRLQFGIRLTF